MWWSHSETLPQIIIKTTTTAIIIEKKVDKSSLFLMPSIHQPVQQPCLMNRPDISQLVCFTRHTPDRWLLSSRGRLCVTTTSQLLV